MADPVMYDDSSPSIRLRGHTLLCLQGFRGEGYSPEFVENMAALHQTLTNHPESWVEVVASPDAVCAACPHQHPSGCVLNGARSEEEMIDQDHVVLQRLGLKVGSRIRWQDILEWIRNSVSGDDLPSICGNCRWLPLGYCREGLNRLHNPVHGAPAEPHLSKPLHD
ncbi:MAG: DUF1284 domain-containing protein [Nitrospiraceae bacterium]